MSGTCQVRYDGRGTTHTCDKPDGHDDGFHHCPLCDLNWARPGYEEQP